MNARYSLFFFLAFSFGLQAQHNCAAHNITKTYLAEQGLSTNLHDALAQVSKGAGLRGGGGLTIPVVFHIVWNTAAENIADATVQAMLQQMNEDYSATNSDISTVRSMFSSDIANVGIQFCLADTDPTGNPTTGITRTQTTETWFDPDTETNDMKSAPKGIAPWDPNSYLNIWICDITSGAVGGSITVGYAYLPQAGIVGSAIDGLVIDYNFGTGAGDRTATHEVGHYLGLLHPWGNTGGCADDDGFNDTPNTTGSTFSCANTSLVTCTSPVQYENFMDYANCSAMFTNEQGAYMSGILTGVRASLLNSNGCSNVSTGPCIPTSAQGTSDGDFIDGVILGGINNTSTGGTAGPSYNDYTTISTSLNSGMTYSVSITSGTYAPDNYAAWIDYDQNGSYSAAEKLGEFATTSASETQSISFTVPASALSGNTTMRVRGVYFGTSEPNPVDPCFGYEYGETEDYGIEIIGGVLAYCIPTSAEGTDDGDFIDAVVLGNINNVATGSTGGPSYVDYTAQSTTVYQGQLHSMSITGGAYNEDNYAAWIDYNMNGVFDASEKLGEFAVTGTFETQNISFTVPPTATIGNTVMRVRGVYHANTEPTPTDPCFDYNWGETEDYSIFVDGTTGITDVAQQALNAYQANDAIVVTGARNNTPLSLLDATGRIVLNTNARGSVMHLSTASLGQGIYILQNGTRSVRIYLQ